MKKLSKTQQELLNHIRKQIEIAKSFDNFKDYWLYEQLIDNLGQKDFNELYEIYEKRFIDWDIEKKYKKYWLDELNNVTSTYTNSRTLQSLERLGYIKIIYDGKKFCDKVQLLIK